MDNDPVSLPRRDGQHREAENYRAAAGIPAAMEAGADPAAMRRPLREASMESREPGAGSIRRQAG